MSVFAIGLNHTTAPLAIREQLAFAVDRLEGALTQFQSTLQAEVALLSTCNRTELYFASSKPTMRNCSRKRRAGWLSKKACPKPCSSRIYTH